jgi:hypothetical protein
MAVMAVTPVPAVHSDRRQRVGVWSGCVDKTRTTMKVGDLGVLTWPGWDDMAGWDGDGGAALPTFCLTGRDVASPRIPLPNRDGRHGKLGFCLGRD